MKKQIYTLMAFLLLTSIVSAQAPNAIPYQGVARNASGGLLVSQNISLRISIHDATANGTVIYTETHSPTTTSLGLFNINIGQGSIIVGEFDTLDWGNGFKFIQVEMDASGGTSYVEMGTTQLMSVPYALYARNGISPGTTPGEMNYWNGSTWDIILPGEEGQTLSFCSGVPTWGPCPIVLTTAAISNIKSLSAISGGVIASGTVTARGVCWSTSPNPTLSDSYTTDGTGTGSFLSNLTGLTDSTTYYVRAYATNIEGTVYGNEIIFTSAPADIGDGYQGGKVAYILQPSDPGYDANIPHGLIAAPSDQSNGVQWGCYQTSISGADGTALGTGNQNTIDIMAGCSTSGIAARLCANLSLNGYNDWFLPSYDELYKLYLNKAAIGSFAGDWYWSSSEFNSSLARMRNFQNGNPGLNNKNTTNKVRAVRAF